MGRGQGASVAVAEAAPRRRPRKQSQDSAYVAPTDLAPAFGHVGTVLRDTDKGLPLRLELHGRVPDNGNEGWVVDLVEAHLTDGSPAGYLKLAYVPADEMTRWFPDVITFAWRRHGTWLPFSRTDATLPPEEAWTHAHLSHVLSSSDVESGLSFGVSHDRYVTRKEESREQLLAEWVARKPTLERRYVREYTEFLHQRRTTRASTSP
jgi:hypothetical protein